MELKRSITTGEKLRGADKLARIPVKVIQTTQTPKKPEWIRAKISNPEEVQHIKDLLRQQKLHTVCEEAACPNLPQCFGGGTATFMIMGDICTRRCPFCDVAHGRPNALDPNEPQHLADTVKNLNLKYVVITSVDRDDLKDGGAQHFVDCIQAIRNTSPETLIEILVPDFRGRLDIALNILSETPPDVFNHNIETVPRLYHAMRPGSDYQHSLELLRKFKQLRPDIATKCGLMVGLGEVEAEVIVLLNDLSDYQVDYVTIGQYLQPSKSHAPIQRFVSLKEFEAYQKHGQLLGFKNIWSAPMVRSSYFADRQYRGEAVPKPFSRENIDYSLE
ncbi:lipoyl synthase [Acinetobacter rudis]|uniref:Lipoyl synthase n=1 Tax=Acinetobacter rudis CIP 110305 TaxID=421052 RepID=S3N336_9GAMM|nr:lipoyl synthase [Acinetobacter rudis]EPF74465.1 lipoyl synthase [Acinetobacter rudis CIP 110305]